VCAEEWYVVGDPAPRGRSAKRALASLLTMLIISGMRPDRQSGVGIFEHALNGVGAMLAAAARVLQEIAELIGAAH
jgi:hypothetical protein